MYFSKERRQLRIPTKHGNFPNAILNPLTSVIRISVIDWITSLHKEYYHIFYVYAAGWGQREGGGANTTTNI